MTASPDFKISIASMAETTTRKKLWDTWVDAAMMHFQGLHGAVIIGLEDGLLWGSSSPSPLSDNDYVVTFDDEDGIETRLSINESVLIAQFMRNKQKPLPGLRLGQKKFVVLRTVEASSKSLPSGRTIFSVFGKAGPMGCCLTVSDRAVIVVTYDTSCGQTAGHCNAVALRTATWLILRGM